LLLPAGGATEVQIYLLAGVLSFIVPSFGYPSLWGWRVGELGIGPKPIPRVKLTTAKLAEAIQQAVNDDGIRDKAARIGQQIRREDGVATAVGMIEAFVRQGHF
jgi:sterol 3beta-glucosyltransferase